MKKFMLLLIGLIILMIASASMADEATPKPIQANYSAASSAIMQVNDYQQLPIEQQQALASVWNLNPKDYSHYLWLMQNTPNGWYYADKHLDPSWILGFNAKDDAERKKFATIAIQNERARIEKELAFQKLFSSLQKELYPNEYPVSYQALDEDFKTSK